MPLQWRNQIWQSLDEGAHTPSITFRHLPPTSAKFGYATEGACTLYLRAAVQRRGQRPPKGPRKHETHPPWVENKKESRLDSNGCGFICAGVNFLGSYK